MVLEDLGGVGGDVATMLVSTWNVHYINGLEIRMKISYLVIWCFHHNTVIFRDVGPTVTVADARVDGHRAFRASLRVEESVELLTILGGTMRK